MDNYKRLSSNEMREDFTKIAKQKFHKKKGAFHILKKVFYYAREYRWYLYLAILMDLIYTVAATLIPIYTGKCINNIISVVTIILLIFTISSTS